MEIDYSRNRSKFWLKVYEEAEHTNIVSNSMIRSLINNRIPELVNCSPTGWRPSQNYDDVYTLWIPYDRLNESAYEEFKEWANHSSSHIWLGTNKNTREFFRGDELDYCLASDWNVDLDSRKRTIIGEAEYQLKYNFPKHIIPREIAKQYSNELASSVLSCIECLPFCFQEFYVSAIPAVKENQRKLAWQLARHISKVIGAPFVEATLLCAKPQMKELAIDEKISIWRNIYSDGSSLILPYSLQGKDVLVIDDLYQSGASVWCYAEFLKDYCGVRSVIAISSVKALKDGDNT